LPDTDVEAFVATIRKKATKHNVSVGVPRDLTSAPPSDRTSLFDVLADVSNEMDERPLTVPSLTPGITDLRYFRARGATAYGWVPLVLDAELLGTIHGHDERIPIDGYKRAVAAMVDVVGRCCGTS
ncbi:MAG TPA: M20/M25/M40 family metallo-hydrolase, partial [Actinomycetota bacterium]|nr:M20/M25/M40 family metallo-hydrolase [Actinomycetota bacterium]